MIEGRTARRISIRFWGSERVVLSEPGQWEIRSWPAWLLLQHGSGSLVVDWSGHRSAVVQPGGDIVLSDGPDLRLPPEAGPLGNVAWLGDGLIAASRPERGRGRPHGSSGEQSTSSQTGEAALWRLPLDGPPVRFYRAQSGIDTLSGLVHMSGSVLCEAVGSARTTLPSRRLIVVGTDGGCREVAPELVGTCSGGVVSIDGRIALTHGGFPLNELVTPMCFTLLVGREGGPWQSLLPSDVRVWGRPSWSSDGSCLVVTAFRGIRLGVVALYPLEDRWEWLVLEEAASYRSPAITPGHDLVAIREPLDAPPAIVAIRDNQHRVLQVLPGEAPSHDCHWEIREWPAPEGPLEGLLATPHEGARPWPLVVDLHGGPQAGLVAGEIGHLATWARLGFAVFAPDFRGSGILGAEAMTAALKGHGLPDDDCEALDILNEVDALVAAGIADPYRLFLFGHSYGAYLANRIVTMDHRFQAAVCWEGVADLRVLDAAVPGGYAAQRALRGGSPEEVPERCMNMQQHHRLVEWTGSELRCSSSTEARAWDRNTATLGSPRSESMTSSPSL